MMVLLSKVTRIRCPPTAVLFHDFCCCRERRVAGVLSDFGCEVVPGKAGRIRPADKDICLSILDYAIPEQDTTKTRALNTLANRVVRTVCVGSDEDLQVRACRV